MSGKALSFCVEEIMKCQQNRYPMLFIDCVTSCIPGEFAKGFKYFSFNEWYFHGHEAKKPKVWSAIQIEALSQMFLMTFLTMDEFRGEITASNKFNKVIFKRKLEPGDRLDLEAKLEYLKRGIAKGTVQVFQWGVSM